MLTRNINDAGNGNIPEYVGTRRESQAGPNGTNGLLHFKWEGLRVTEKTNQSQFCLA